MACRYTFQGKTYEAHEFDDVLRAMQPVDAAKYMPSVKAIPSAPMIGKTDAWVSLAIKRMIRYAAENGFDKVALINGQQAADLYDLSKQISRVNAVKDFDGKTYTIGAFDISGREVLQRQEVEEDKLSDYVGKDLAEKIVAMKNGEGKQFKGLDLKVGGEGMRAFYDEIVPSVARDVLRKLGVSPHSLGGKAEFSKVIGNSTLVDSKFFSNLVLSKTFVDKGFKGIDAESKRLVQSKMLAIGKDGKILKSVIRAIPVDVMNVLNSQKLSAEMFFHDPAMLINYSVVPLRPNMPTFVDVSSALIRGIASATAKEVDGFGISDSVGFSGKDSAATGTLMGSHNITPSSSVGLEADGVSASSASSIIHPINIDGVGQQLGFTITPELRAKALEGLPLFSRQQSKFSEPAGNQRYISADRLQQAVDTVTKVYQGLPKVNSLDSYKSAPEELVADIERDNAQSAAGAWHNGEIYLFRNKIANGHHATFTIMHEGTHEGLRRTYGKDIDPVLMSIYLTNKDVKAQADAIRKAHKDLTLVGSVEEVLADMGGNGIKASVMDKLVAFVRGALRKMGVTVNFTDGEVRALVTRALDSVKRPSNVRTVVGTSAYNVPENQRATVREYSFGEQTLYEVTQLGHEVGTYSSRAAADDLAKELNERDYALGSVGHYSRQKQTDTPQFKAWFGDSKVVDADGMPMVVYHGADNSFNEFDTLTGAYFVADENIAKGYSDNGNKPVATFLLLKNPKIFSMQDRNGASSSYLTEKEIDKLIAEGYDGAIGYMDGTSYKEYVAFEPNQIKSATENNGDFDPNNNDIRYSRHYQANPAQEQALRNVGAIVDHQTIQQWFAQKKTELTSNLAQKIADQFAPLKELDMHAYILARMSKSYDGAMEALLNFGNIYIDAEGTNNTDINGGNNFIKTLQRLQGEQQRFFWWIAANRAEQLTAEGRENLFGDTDIQTLKGLNTGALPDGQDRSVVYQAVLDEYNKVSKSVLDAAEASGIINGASRAIWEKEFYVPFYRALEDGISSPNIGSKQGLVRQYAFKKLKGGSQKIHHDLMANVLMNWTHLIAASGRNRAAIAALKAGEQAGIASAIAEPVKGSVYYLENGEQKHYLVDDPAVMDAITSLEYSGLGGGAMKVLSAFKRTLTYGVTFSPTFKIRNIIRDTLAALAINDIGLNPLQNIKQGVDIMRHKDSQQYASLLAGGGIIRFGSMLEGNSSIHLNRLINSGIDRNNIIDNKEKALDLWTKATDWYSELGDISEGANRAALYQQLRDKGLSHLEASYQARDMLDFTMGGTSGAIRFLVQTVPFMNARIQGLYKLGRAGQANPKRMGAVIGAMALASIMLMLAYGDDEDWKKREDWDRDNYWWFKIGGIAYRIPKPFEVGSIATLAERGLEYLTDDEMTNKRMMERIKFAVSQTLSFNPVPQLFKPAIDVYSNVDSFTGRPIETMGMERLQKQDRVTRNTSEAARALGTVGQYADLSPVQIDHLVRGYFGWLGIAANTIVDTLVSPVTDRPVKPSAQIKDMFLVGSFAEELPANQSRYLTQFYEQSKEIEEAYASWRKMISDGDIDSAKEFRAENSDALKQYHRVQHQKKLLTSLNHRIDQIYNSSMDADTKRVKINALTQRKIQLSENISKYLE